MEHTYSASSDLTICCGEFVFHVDRDILSKASPVFWALLNGPFIESSSKRITIQEDDPYSLKQVLDIMYSGISRDLVMVKILNNDSSLDAVANKYDLAGVHNIITISREKEREKESNRFRESSQISRE
jgi:hypothetical protein